MSEHDPIVRASREAYRAETRLAYFLLIINAIVFFSSVGLSFGMASALVIVTQILFFISLVVGIAYTFQLRRVAFLAELGGKETEETSAKLKEMESRDFSLPVGLLRLIFQGTFILAVLFYLLNSLL
jgi:magnesium-transporting ATPase (P-type)